MAKETENEGYWEGKVTKGEGSDFYKVTYCGMPFPVCFGGALRYCDELRDRFCKDGSEPRYAWGYDGEGPQHLAFSMLHVYAGHPDSWVSNRGKLVPADPMNKDWDYTVRYDCPPLRNPPLSDHFAASHYKQFAAEVIANLPDNWRLTFADIDRWLQQKQQTKTKDERESTKEPGTSQ